MTPSGLKGECQLYEAADRLQLQVRTAEVTWSWGTKHEDSGLLGR
jgi:hypothetical protein